ncbi:MAG: tetratricopeptide repeat protein [Bacteroidota bacterium]|nr:tetratricopeptide repeat protein [Bacteroidota bacterium]
MIKKAFLFIIAVNLVTVINAQNVKVVSAFNYLKNGNLEKAKLNIDDASQNESTMGKAKTWLYKGNVYYLISTSNDPKYKNLDTNALQIAHESFKKALDLDKSKEYETEIPNGINNCSIEYFKKGVGFYQKQQFSGAMKNFEYAYNIAKEIGRIDTGSLLNAGISAELSKSTDKAKQFYNDLVNMNYKKASIYISLSNIYKNEKDTVKALTIIKQGRKLLPDEYSLIIAETNIYLQTGKKKEAEEILKIALQKDPSNPTLYFAIGTGYENSNDFENAEKSYKKAIELKQDYFDAYYNLGALYFNDGVKIFDNANKLDPTTEQAKYEAEKAKFEERFKQSIPWLEKAMEINPNDQNTLISLKQLYTRTNQPDKLKAINEKLKK